MPSISPSPWPNVCIIGAGPVGLFLSLLLAHSGVTVEVLEASAEIIQSPRAVVYHPPVLNSFCKAGILPTVLNAGVKNTTGISWRAPGGELLGRLGLNGDFSVLLGQHRLCGIILREIERYGNVKVSFGYRYVSCEQGDDKVTVCLEHGEDKRREVRECKFLIGADGGKSPVRNSLGIPLEGFTWEEVRFVAADVRCEIEKHGWDVMNFMVDERDWAVVVKIGGGDLWRIATGEKCGEREEVEDQERLRERYRRILPPGTEVEFISTAEYTMHQRCAQRFVVGNVVLVGDAAHLNNPIGGLGLTTGLLDAAHLGEALHQILVGGRPSYEVLKDYEEQRRKAFLDMTNRSSILQKNRLMSTELGDIREREEFFERLNGPGKLEFERRLAEEQMQMATMPG
ncbi:FAD/NAD(P)-binding domain-containing protein [Wilcoxina mikolae CBS 423.85]|nr:FAD/NAD(P)-binding domain-containing protein [Wilcoxina mikolae CBS 423.85]